MICWNFGSAVIVWSWKSFQRHLKNCANEDIHERWTMNRKQILGTIHNHNRWILSDFFFFYILCFGFQVNKWFIDKKVLNESFENGGLPMNFNAFQKQLIVKVNDNNRDRKKRRKTIKQFRRHDICLFVVFFFLFSCRSSLHFVFVFYVALCDLQRTGPNLTKHSLFFHRIDFIIDLSFYH